MLPALASVYMNARVPGLGMVDLHVAEGRLARIAPAEGGRPLPSDAVDLGGRLTLPPLVESHVHLEKAYLLDRLPRPASSLADAIRLTAEAKASFTAPDMRRRALRFLRAMLRVGVTHVRAHVEIDDTLGITAVETMLGLREELRDVVDLQVVAFPQEGLLAQRSAIGLLQRAADLGVDAIGGIPYADADEARHLRIVFDAAERTGLPLDFHADLSDDATRLSAVEIARLAIASGMRGRVTIGHLTALGSAPADRVREVCALLAEAEVSVVVLPLTDLYLGGRADDHAPRRGLAPLRALHEAGVNVAVSTNNVQNAFTPFGRGSILDAALVLAAAAHLGTTEEMMLMTDMMTRNAARAIGIADYGIREGAPADFAVFDAVEPRELVGDVTAADLVVKGGRAVTPDLVAAA
jgi:cytosine/creatinine deaminase